MSNTSEMSSTASDNDMNVSKALAAFEAEIGALDVLTSTAPKPVVLVSSAIISGSASELTVEKARAGMKLADGGAQSQNGNETNLVPIGKKMLPPLMPPPPPPAQLAGVMQRNSMGAANRVVMSEPARPAAVPVTTPMQVANSLVNASGDANASAASQHSYSSAYGDKMKKHYDEMKEKAKKFQAARLLGGYGKVRQTIVREAAGTSWVDPSLSDWPENDFRLFCGDLSNEVDDDVLRKAFDKYPSFAMARVVKHNHGKKKTRGFGFVSFLDANDYAKAYREMDGKYIGNRPLKLRKSKWKDRNAKS